MLFDRPRNWKWLVPGALVSPCLVWWSQWEMAEGWQRDWALVPMTLTILLFMAALVNLVLYVYYYLSQYYSDIRAAQNDTPEVKMFEAASKMHPEAVKALLVHRRTVWEVQYIPQADVVDWTYRDAPSVHAGFVDFVLDHSNATSIMSKRLLSQGSKQFDPENIVTDYEQYDGLVLLMEQKLMITKAYGNQPGQWLPPWSPQLARHRFGLDGDVGSYEEASKGKLVQAVVRAQEKTGGNGQVEEIPLSQSPLDKLPKKAAKAPVNVEADDGVAITDEEWEAVQREEAAHRERYMS